MNTELILKTADAIEASAALERGTMEAPKFDMGVMETSEGECGTACCIAGWMVFIADGAQALHGMTTGAIDIRATELADIDDDTNMRLFYADGSSFGWGDITAEMAARTLRNLVETGDVVWGI